MVGLDFTAMLLVNKGSSPSSSETGRVRKPPFLFGRKEVAGVNQQRQGEEDHPCPAAAPGENFGTHTI